MISFFKAPMEYDAALKIFGRFRNVFHVKAKY